MARRYSDVNKYAIDDLVTISQAAKILKMSVSTLRRYEKSGKIIPISNNPPVGRLYSKKQLLKIGKGS